MDTQQKILKNLELCNYKVVTDTRVDMNGAVFFALKGESFDGNEFVEEALEKGAVAAVTENSTYSGDNIYVVPNVLTSLQLAAKTYRETFKIPILAIAGSNGKTTSKELTHKVLSTKYKTHSTIGSLNNHIGVPLTILSMPTDTKIGVFEIGANHPGEHIELLNILFPTHTVVTNNGMDHLEGFGSPEGSRKANKEIYDWAKTHNTEIFVHKNHEDLKEDSNGGKVILYPDLSLKTVGSTPLTIEYNKKVYRTNLVGDFNIENIELAVSIGQHFNIDSEEALKAICEFIPTLRRSQFVSKNGINFIVDCYNANPTSMKLSIDSFLNSNIPMRGIVLGDMLELGNYTEKEHEKILNYINNKKFETVVLIGNNFKKALDKTNANYKWFENSEKAGEWFKTQNFQDYTFLLKGSRGLKIEKIFDL